jgi:uracil-DNA glycosylase family 4
MWADQEYWGRPVPTFGPPDARLLILGLAPAAHGANRTGRMFTGDSSGDWLYEALHRFEFASQPESMGKDDGLELIDCTITAAAHCAPPNNRPTREELDACRRWLHRELDLLDPEVVIVLGRIAWETWWKVLAERGVDLPRPRPGFAHGQWIELEGQIPVLQSYHPSRQNTNTGRLTRPAWHSIFRKARKRIG